MFALSAVKNGSYATTRILKPLALSATIDPMFPHPIIPNTFPVTSKPIYLDFSHLPR